MRRTSSRTASVLLVLVVLYAAACAQQGVITDPIVGAGQNNQAAASR